ncbi:ABC-three component system middle component 6 [Schleiferilactobacillus perolens]|uniref:ABC-three component system middle component 6 n=1 Tax=Schleiferilactobacillus perolens TaxID=100468 RepID=UPI00070F55AF
MLLLDLNKAPQDTVYYLSAVVEEILSIDSGLDYSSLMNKLNDQLRMNVNPTFFNLALSFLYLLDKIVINERGELYVHQEPKNHKF